MRKLIGSTARWAVFPPMRSTTLLARCAVAAVLLGSAAACSEQADPLVTGPDLAITVESVNDQVGVYCTGLLAGQTIDSGDVCVSIADNDGDGYDEDLEITYTTTDGWELEEAHLWVGTTSEGYPKTNKGNPKVGNFPHHSGDISGATTYTFSIPLSEFGIFDDGQDCGDLGSLYAMAHAALRKDLGGGTYQTETGWGNGDRVVEKGNWATRMEFTLTKSGCDGDPPDDNTETAFAYGGLLTSGVGGVDPDGVAQCFLGIDEDLIWVGEVDGRNPYLDGDFSRWGWTNGGISAPYTGSWKLYAGAGQCKLGNGTHVGTVTVTYIDGTVEVAYSMFSGYTLNEAHVYVGDTKMPYNGQYRYGEDGEPAGPGAYTVAPGQYTEVDDDDSIAGVYTFTGVTGPVWVIAHAAVGGFEN